jgi:hypothetical protein
MKPEPAHINSLLLFLFLACSVMQGQEMKSGKSMIFVNNQKVETPKTVMDTVPPVIKILSPMFSPDGKLESNKAELTILGKTSDEISGINRLYINAQQFDLAPDGLFVKMIPLSRGDNKIEIIAVDSKDNYARQTFTVSYVSESSAASGELKVNGSYYALLIGISKYQDPQLPDLDQPVKDAESLYSVLVTHYLFDPQNVILLKNVSRSDINDALDLLAQKITPEDNLLIFYAGHGWWDEKANIGYWLPADAKRNLKADWFRNSTLCDYITEINSRHTLLITDACFGGSIFKTRSISLEAPKAIQMLYDLPSRKAMTSGTITEVPDRSSFVRYLVERLYENKEKCISSEQLFASFRIAVINNSDVIPQYGEIKNVGDQGGDFIFIRRDK